MIKEEWVQHMIECLVVDGQNFEKDRWKEATSESEDECSVSDSE